MPKKETNIEWDESHALDMMLNNIVSEYKNQTMNTTQIAEQDLIKLGFKIQNETPESSGVGYDWYYYTLNIGDVCLISNASDDFDEFGWTISIFDSETCKITSIVDLTNLVRILNNSTR